MKTAGQRRSVRVDAARNAERIVVAAWQVFAERGADAQLEEIARRAGVGVATLYRHYANKEELVRAVLLWRFAEDVEPVIQRAQRDADPWDGMVAVLEAALTMASREHGTLAAAPYSARLADDLADRFLDALSVTVRRAQAEGAVRADLAPDDLPRLTIMLISVMRLEDGPSQSWRRYLALMLDALRPAAASALPPVTPPARPRPDHG